MVLLLLTLVACALETADLRTPRRDAPPDDTAVADTAAEDTSGDTADCLVAWRYLDADGDAFGDPTLGFEGCETPGYVENGNDCDDSEGNAYPGNLEVCDEIDNNCDGLADEGVRWYPDGDGDGYGPGEGSCDPSAGTTHLPGDCNDADPMIYPGAADVENGLDDDCDGHVDGSTDHDGDGYTAADGDCDDADATMFPGADETCDGVDEDCDDRIDDLENGNDCP